MTAVIRRGKGPSLDDVLLETRFGAMLIPANDELSGAQADLLNTMSGETILQRVLAPIRDQYDFVLIDTPADLTLLTINALVAADRVLIPIETEYLSVKGGRKLMEAIAVVQERLNPNLDVDGILLTKTANTTISREISEQARQVFEQALPVYTTTIRKRVALANAQRRHQTIFEFDPKSESVEDFRNLAKEVIANGKKASR